QLLRSVRGRLPGNARPGARAFLFRSLDLGIDRLSGPNAAMTDAAGSIPDPIAAGLARGWKVVDGPALPDAQEITCDVAIVGTGAGGVISADTLANAGLSVVLIEEGPLKSSRDFTMREAEAYPALY